MEHVAACAACFKPFKGCNGTTVGGASQWIITWKVPKTEKIFLTVYKNKIK